MHILSLDKCEVVQGSLFLDENRVNLIYSEIKACAYVDRYDRGTREVFIWNLVPCMLTHLYLLLVVKILFCYTLPGKLAGNQYLTECVFGLGQRRESCHLTRLHKRLCLSAGGWQQELNLVGTEQYCLVWWSYGCHSQTARGLWGTLGIDCSYRKLSLSLRLQGEWSIRLHRVSYVVIVFGSTQKH